MNTKTLPQQQMMPPTGTHVITAPQGSHPSAVEVVGKLALGGTLFVGANVASAGINQWLWSDGSTQAPIQAEPLPNPVEEDPEVYISAAELFIGLFGG